MEFFSGILIGLIIGFTIMCVLAVIPDDEDEFEMDIEEEKEEKK
jgi:hypothetical protein